MENFNKRLNLNFTLAVCFPFPQAHRHQNAFDYPVVAEGSCALIHVSDAGWTPEDHCKPVRHVAAEIHIYVRKLSALHPRP